MSKKAPSSIYTDFEDICYIFLKEIVSVASQSKKLNSKATHKIIEDKLCNWMFSEIPFLYELTRDEFHDVNLELHQSVKTVNHKRHEKLISNLKQYHLLGIAKKINLARIKFKEGMVGILSRFSRRFFEREKLFDFSDKQLKSLARRIAFNNPDLPLRASKNIQDCNNNSSYIFVSHLFPTTWLPTVAELRSKGKHTTWLGVNPVHEFGSYGVAVNTSVNTDKVITDGLLITLMVLAKCTDCKILLSGECFIGSNWKKNDTTLLYMVMTAVTSMIRSTSDKNNLTLMMYDGIKPFSDQDQGNQSISYFYRAYMRNADRIIYNSNTPEFGDFMENSINLTAPKLHFYRYGYSINGDAVKKYPLDEIHIGCITVVLNEFAEPSRDGVTSYIEKICRSGIHFHYFCKEDDRAVRDFIDRLGPDEKYFHPHKIEKDPVKLVNKIAQFHFGFNPSDHVPFAHGIAGMDDRFYQDSLSMFWQSTVATSFLVYASAGLPVILPRGCTGSVKMLGESAFPINLVEMPNLKTIFEKEDLNGCISKAFANAYNFDINNRIQDMIEFIEQ